MRVVDLEYKLLKNGVGTCRESNAEHSNWNIGKARNAIGNDNTAMGYNDGDY